MGDMLVLREGGDVLREGGDVCREGGDVCREGMVIRFPLLYGATNEFLVHNIPTMTASGVRIVAVLQFHAMLGKGSI